VTKDPDFGWDPAADAARTVEPGLGVFIRLPAAAGNQTITFVGEVVQGQNLTVATPVGFSLVSSIVPQEGTATALGYTPVAGDSLYFFNEATQQYVIRSWDADFQDFDLPLPSLGVGEAFFVRKTQASNWTRSFNVNG